MTGPRSPSNPAERGHATGENRNETPTFAVIGLGEAGSAIARDLVAAGVPVRGWDPSPRGDVRGIPLARDQRHAIVGADVVLSVNAAHVALAVVRTAAEALRPGQLYADLNTSAPALKRELAAVVEPSGAAFVDVALTAPVPGNGVRTPALVSGPGAARFADLLRPFGMPLIVLDDEPGSAAGRKLLRSVFMKGLAAAVIEALTAAEAAGALDWVRGDIEHTLTEADARLVERLVLGSRQHAVRRIEEMQATAEYLDGLGVPPRIARASAEWLAQLAREGATQNVSPGA